MPGNPIEAGQGKIYHKSGFTPPYETGSVPDVGNPTRMGLPEVGQIFSRFHQPELAAVLPGSNAASPARKPGRGVNRRTFLAAVGLVATGTAGAAVIANAERIGDVLNALFPPVTDPGVSQPLLVGTPSSTQRPILNGTPPGSGTGGKPVTGYGIKNVLTFCIPALPVFVIVTLFLEQKVFSNAVPLFNVTHAPQASKLWVASLTIVSQAPFELFK